LIFISERKRFIADVSAALGRRRVPRHLLTRLAQKALQLSAQELCHLILKVYLEKPLGNWKEALSVASIYAESGALTEALGLLKGWEIPDRPEINHALGTIMMLLGNREESVELFFKVVDKSPLSMPSWLSLINQFDCSKEPALIGRLSSLNSKVEKLDPFSRIQYSAALSKALFDREDFTNGFQVLQRGSAIYLNTLRGKVDGWRHEFDRCSQLQSEMIRTFEPSQEKTEPGPVFILGLPRSGTTLVEQVLSSHPEVGEGGEFHGLAAVLPPYESLADVLKIHEDGQKEFFTSVAKEYYETHSERFGKSGLRIFDKTLSHAFRAGLVARVFPNAQFVYVKRDPVATALSCFRTCFSKGNLWSFSLREIANYFVGYEEILLGWHHHLEGKLYEVRYEDLIKQPKTTIAGLTRFLGLEESAEMLNFHLNSRPVQTASVNQVRQPFYNSDEKRLNAVSPLMNEFFNYYRK